MAELTFDLVGLLDLEPIEVNLFRGVSPHAEAKRVFGGQVIAQAMSAACRTVEGRLPHSLHAYFILPGDASVPIVYEVGRLRDGRSFSTRRVTAIQHGQAIFSMIVSFHAEESGFDHQSPMPDVPMPEDIDIEAVLAELGPKLPRSLQRFLGANGAVDIRPVYLDRYRRKPIPEGRNALWMKANAPLPEDAMMHRIALAYASDMALLDVVLARYGSSIFSFGMQAASLDHAMWFHRPFRADEWLLYYQDSPNAHGGRGLARGSFYRRDGTLVATVQQEGLLRQAPPTPPGESGKG